MLYHTMAVRRRSPTSRMTRMRSCRCSHGVALLRPPFRLLTTVAAVLLLTVCNVLELAAAQGSSSASCTLCSDGGDFDAQGRIGTVRCQEVQTYLAATDGDSPVCFDAQLQGYLYCSCASYPTDVFCPMCENGSTDLANPDAMVDTLTPPKTCRDALFAKKSNNDECIAIAAAASEVCGCTAAPPPLCSLCGSGSVQYPDRALPPDFVSQTCDQLASLAPSVSDEDCANFASNLTSLVDVRAYCGCSDASQGTCGNLCQNGQVVINPDSTVMVMGQSLSCQLASDAAPFVMDADLCEALQAAAPSCCGAASPAAPTSPSAPSPAAPPSGPTAAPPSSSAPTSGAFTAISMEASLTLGGLLVLLRAGMGW